MASHAWHPYAPDQEFGRQAARDEDLLDTMLRALDDDRAGVPRAANKASARTSSAVARAFATRRRKRCKSIASASASRR